jgi:PHD/YefM family antitoxin component YafN of YafNO toxin-antitoxin module
MITVPASEFSKNFGKYRETAQREPVAVTSHERITGYFVSAQEYEKYQQLKSRLPQALSIDELSTQTLQALAQSRMDDRHHSLNRLLEE